MFEPGPSVPIPISTPRSRAAGYGNNAAYRQLQVRHRVRHHRRSALGDQIELIVVKPDAVGEDRVRPQQPGPVEVERRPHPMLGDAVLHLLLGLGEVNLNGRIALGRSLGHPASESGPTV